MDVIKKIIREEIEKINSGDSYILYHGTRGLFPFENFVKSMDGTGVVSLGGRRYGGFFFTDEPGNAEYYGEWLIAKVKVNKVKEDPLGSSHPPTVLKKAVEDNESYIVRDVLDGSMHSNVVLVPHSRISDVDILSWEFVGDKDFYFEVLDDFFGGMVSMDDDDEPMEDILRYTIDSFFEMTESNLEYALKVPEFKEYYLSKENYS